MLEESRVELKYFHIARFVLESKSAFSINSGLTDQTFDNLLVKDANGLPAIPGTTLAGVIRSQYRRSGAAHENVLFGGIVIAKDADGNETEVFRKSRIECSWGVVHNCHDEPVEGRADLSDDDVLNVLKQDHPLVRERVSLSLKGVAVKKHKFDHTCVPQGCRFSAEIGYWASQSHPPEWQLLLDLITGEHLRIGNSTSAGFGEFACIRLKCRGFDLSNPDDYADYAKLPVSLADTTGWRTHESDASESLRNQRMSLTLKPEDYWRVGEGARSLATETANEPNLLPWHESEILWNEKGNTNASLGERLVVVPGSAIKGVLRHRFRFHAHRLKLSCDDADMLARKATNLLFGQAGNYRDRQSAGGRSCLFVSNAQMTTTLSNENIQAITHSSIDRLTGGVRSGALFIEEMLWNLGLEFRIELDPVRMQYALKEYNLPEAINTHYLAEALSLTLDDLCEGRLALGAGSNRGHGYFAGERDRDFDFSQIDTIRDEVAA